MNAWQKEKVVLTHRCEEREVTFAYLIRCGVMRERARNR